ncbi:TonB-dependent siderophore receptor [Sphingobium sufflavum]|uniref:TonB-dependent siderophore receptor n=1 Tax=Sphingobium sufflavum TaxID=1129547 RepID=UPI001F224C50|nr:TonB-dependent siderophore receptor [Sphingobium sufflavum]MCE7797122.1 TonB-dependent siderophore receptor [Sphingobium sufflavum]
MSAIFALIAATTAAPLPAADADTTAARPAGDEIIVTGQRTDRQDDYAVKKQTTTMRFPLSQRETPQSVSIVTRAQIEDFKLNDINDLLKAVPGVQVQPNDTDRISYSARGFDIQTFQIDGIGLPFAFGIQTGSIDTAIYDHIDVVKGAPGLLSSTGNPSAVVNFVRKRPTKDLRASANVQYGSYNDLRLDADVSVPITSDGSVRARAVGVFDDSDSYLDRYHLRRWTGYGIVEADLGPDTTLTVGYGHQDHQSRGAMWGSLPLYYTDGTRIDLPVSANTGPSWAGWGVIDRQIFGDIVHHFNEDWHAKLTVIRRAVNERNTLFYLYGNPDRASLPSGINPVTFAGVYTYPGKFTAKTRNLTVDAYIAGKVSLFGRQHDVMFGVNRSAQEYKQYSSYDFSTVGIALPLPNVYDGSFPLPNFPTSFDLSLDQNSRRESVYGLVRLHLVEPLKVMLGANYTHARADGYSYGTPTSFNRSRFLPFVGATLDLNDNFSAYASYATIFNPQTEVDSNNQILKPIEGNNWEGGVKGEWYGGRLHASLALFQTRQNNTAQAGPFIGGRTIYTPVNSKSQGIELDFGGEILPGLQATGGYTLMRIRGDDNLPTRTFVPRHQGKLNVTYSPTALPAIKVGAAIQYQSQIYVKPRTSDNSDFIRSSTTGAPIKLVQPDYVLIDLMAKYSFTDNLSVSANLKNLTNVKYLGALNYDQAYHGAPRTVLGTISLKY